MSRQDQQKKKRSADATTDLLAIFSDSSLPLSESPIPLLCVYVCLASSAEEVSCFLRALREVMRDVGVCLGDLSTGALRCDVNVSIHPRLDFVPERDFRPAAATPAIAAAAAAAATGGGGSSSPLPAYSYSVEDVARAHAVARRTAAAGLGLLDGLPKASRVEVKNINSIAAVVRAIDYECRRHFASLVFCGALVDKETRAFNARTGTTTLLRGKEDALDYRFLPDPDLPPLVVDPAWVEVNIRAIQEAWAGGDGWEKGRNIAFERNKYSGRKIQLSISVDVVLKLHLSEALIITHFFPLNADSKHVYILGTSPSFYLIPAPPSFRLLLS